MKHSRFTFLLVAPFAFALAGCNSTGDSKDVSELANNDGMVCKMEKRTGSNRMTRICYTADERDQMQEAAREGWLRLQRSSETGADR